MKGNTMNSKLLKACAAVMLIASAGNADAAKKGSGQKDFSVELVTNIQAVMSIETPSGEIKDLSFYGDDGKKTSDESRTIPFKTYNACCNGKIVIQPGTGVILDNGKWYVLNVNAKTNDQKQDSNYRLGFSLTLKNEGNVKKLENGCSYAIGANDKEDAWSLFVAPNTLTSTMEAGEYRGALKIAIEAV